MENDVFRRNPPKREVRRWSKDVELGAETLAVFSDFYPKKFFMENTETVFRDQIPVNTRQIHMTKIANIQNMPVQFIKATNDYSVGGTEAFVSHFGTLPTHSDVTDFLNVKEDPDVVLNAVKAAFTQEGVKFSYGKGCSRQSIGGVESEDDDENEDAGSSDIDTPGENEYCSVVREDLLIDVGLKMAVNVFHLDNKNFVLIVQYIHGVPEIPRVLAKAKESLTKELVKEFPEDTLLKNRFYLIVKTSDGFSLERTQFSKEFDESFVDDNYNDDFKTVDERIKKTIDGIGSGLVLLHGDPGTGKTHYLKMLISRKTRKRIVLVPPDMVRYLSSPDFILFAKTKMRNCVMVIEDAEEVLFKRGTGMGSESSVSNMLNLTDGILGDALNMVFICTFNSGLEEIDPAALREGRLRARYKFDSLTVDKTERLMQKVNGVSANGKRMTLAEIYNYADKKIDQVEDSKPKPVTFGFVAK